MAKQIKTKKKEREKRKKYEATPQRLDLCGKSLNTRDEYMGE